MRNAFAEQIEELATHDERIVLLSGDIGNRMFDSFKSAFPDKFYNCGVAEANMTSIAAGLASSEMRPITYTIAAFNTLRCLEQIRFDIAYPNLPVIVVGVGAGLSYASLNASHHALEDIACLRAIPNMAVLCPGDAFEVKALLTAALDYGGPVYLRLGKKNEPKIHTEIPKLSVGKNYKISEGEDVCLLSTGTVLPMAIETSNALEKQGISTQVISMHSVKPLDKDNLAEVFDRFPIIASIEEHGLAGGAGSAISEWIVDHRDHGETAKFMRFGTEDKFMYCAGEQSYARNHFNLSSEKIASAILQEFRKQQ